MTVEIRGEDRKYKLKNMENKTMYTIEIGKCCGCGCKPNYFVTVTQRYDLKEPVEISRQYFEDKDVALKTVESLVSDYETLVLVDMKKQPTPKDIFFDSVDYHVTIPETCRNCRHSEIVRRCHEDNHFHGHPHLVCTNRENIKELSNIEEDYGRVGSYTQVFDVKVDPDGTCKNFEPKEA